MGQTFTYTIPAPSLGLNFVDPIDDMDPRYALELSNVVAAGLTCYQRNGYYFYSDLGVAGSSPTVMLQNISFSSGTSRLIAHCGTTLKDVTATTGTTIGGPYSLTPFNSDTFGQRAFLANGVDTVQEVYTGSAANSTFTGVTLSNLINVFSYKERIYFIEKNTLKVWYGPTQAITGALTSFDFQFAMKEGGYLVMGGSYNEQAAQTAQELLWVLSSEGELLFYAGSYPGDTTTPWGIVKRYKVGKPLGYKAKVRIGDDFWILTDLGLISLRDLFQSNENQALKGVGDKVNPYIVQQAAQFSFGNYWTGTFWPRGRRVYITVPLSTTESTILVYHLDGGWSFYDISNNLVGNIMCVSDGILYYGAADDTIYLGEYGQSDNTVAINTSGRLAFNFFGSRGLFKAFKDCRPLIKSSRTITLSLGIDTDFKRIPDLSTVTTASGVYTPWGSSWGSPWSGGTEYIYERHTLNGQGHSGAFRFKGALLDSSLEIYGFEIGFEQAARV